MHEFNDLFWELRTILDDSEAYYSQISSQLDPNLVDELRAYAASRNIALHEAFVNALQLFMLSAAEEAWRALAAGAGAEKNADLEPLNLILGRFLAIALDPSRQRLIEGPHLPSILNQFRRMRE